eukprot:6127941-Pleurochrysis_carterae.AAC.3
MPRMRFAYLGSPPDAGTASVRDEEHLSWPCHMHPGNHVSSHTAFNCRLAVLSALSYSHTFKVCAWCWNRLPSSNLNFL